MPDLREGAWGTLGLPRCRCTWQRHSSELALAPAAGARRTGGGPSPLLSRAVDHLAWLRSRLPGAAERTPGGAFRSPSRPSRRAAPRTASAQHGQALRDVPLPHPAPVLLQHASLSFSPAVPPEVCCRRAPPSPSSSRVCPAACSPAPGRSSGRPTRPAARPEQRRGWLLVAEAGRSGFSRACPSTYRRSIPK